MITKEFVLAGRAVFTIDCPAEWSRKHGFIGNHRTFRVNRKEEEFTTVDASGEVHAETSVVYFVGMLTGPDNTRDYTYIANLNPVSGVAAPKGRSRMRPDSLVMILLNRVLFHVWAGDTTPITAAGFDVHHEGRCGRCSKPLTVPESILSGFGPECVKKVRA